MNKKLLLTYIYSTLFTLFVCLLFVRGYTPYVPDGENFFYVEVNGQYVGSVGERELVDKLVREARRTIALETEDMTFLDADVTVTGKEVVWGQTDPEEEVLQRVTEALRSGIIATHPRAYTVKLNDMVLNLASLDEVTELLQGAVDKYDADGLFSVGIRHNNDREFNVLTIDVLAKDEVVAVEAKDYSCAGAAAFIKELKKGETDIGEKTFEDYDTGVLSMNFMEKIEVVEAYVPESRLTPLATAVNDIVADQEVPQIYKVQAGDTLSEIAIKLDIPMETLIALNDSLIDERSILQIDQELVAMVPEPVLSVYRVEQNYYEEIYDEEVITIDVDDWYTNQIEVVQQPSAGFRKIIADVTYRNDTVISKDILKEEVVMAAVPKIVKRGTKIPPTYVKPISGGRFTSGFGKRNAPTKGASTYHKGVDWAIPTGTAIYASCGGKVSKAGWGSGYGYVVYIDHEDGKQTRYGHCSKVLVSVGDKVKQGDKIALSGNTGITTGPHLHFEILVDGKQVNPFNYVSK